MIHWEDHPLGDSRATCPGCGRSPKDRTLGITIEADGRGVAHCFRCQYVEVHTPDGVRQRPGQAIPRLSLVTKRPDLSEFGLELWAACLPVARTIGEQYLRARGCCIPPEFGHLRFHPALRHPSGYTGPALVGLITDYLSGAALSLHRTWVRPDGRKADVDPSRLVLKGHSSKGVIRLWPDEFVSYGLAVGEGIESCLSLAHGIRPVWSCVNAGNLSSLPVLPGIESLLIGADHDPAGIQAAEACAERWATAGADVRIVLPPEPKQDLNDMIREAA